MTCAARAVTTINMDIGGLMKEGALVEYEEDLIWPSWFRLTIFGAMAVIAALSFASLAGTPGVEPWHYPLFILVWGGILFVALSLQRLSIRLTSDNLRFGYAIQKKTIPVGSIESCEASGYDPLRHFIWQVVRLAFWELRVCHMPGASQGVEIIARQGRGRRRYFVSSAHPEELVAAIRSTLSGAQRI